MGNKTVDEEELDELIRKREAEVKRLTASVAVLPKKVPLDTVLAPDRIVQLERERKVLVDAIKLTAYRAESALARLVEPFFARHDEETRKFLKSVFQATADIIPDQRSHRLTVKLHGLASPRATSALADLCDLVSERDVTFPGTDLHLHFEAPRLQKWPLVGQEPCSVRRTPEGHVWLPVSFGIPTWKPSVARHSTAPAEGQYLSPGNNGAGKKL